MHTPTDSNPEPLLAASTSPLTPSEEKWLDYAAEEHRQMPLRLEEAAKYMAGLISICLTIFLDKKPNGLSPRAEVWLSIAALLWLGAAVLSFVVLFPRRYRYASDSPESIARLHGRISDYKYKMLIGSAVLFLLGMAIGVWAVWGLGTEAVSVPVAPSGGR